jgi:hypothetical protein
LYLCNTPFTGVSLFAAPQSFENEDFFYKKHLTFFYNQETKGYDFTSFNYSKSDARLVLEPLQLA